MSLQHLLGLLQVPVAEEWPREAGVGHGEHGQCRALAQHLGRDSVGTASPRPGTIITCARLTLPQVKLQHQYPHSHLKGVNYNRNMSKPFSEHLPSFSFLPAFSFSFLPSNVPLLVFLVLSP